MPSNALVKVFLAVTPSFEISDRSLFLIVSGMFLVGAVMAIMELLKWWKKQSELSFRPPSRVFTLLSSVSKFKRGLKTNLPQRLNQSAKDERQRSPSKAA